MVFDWLRSDEKRAKKLTTRATTVSPEVMVGVLDDLEEFLDHEEAAVRQHAGTTIYHLVDKIEYVVNSDHVERTIDESVLEEVARAIVTLLDDPDPDARQSAAMAAPILADVAPTALEPHADALIEFIERESDDVIRSNGHRAIRDLLDARPVAVTPAMLVSSDEMVRSRAISACVSLSQSELDAVLPLVPALLEQLDDSEADVATPAAETLRRVAQRRSDALAEALENADQIPKSALPRPVTDLVASDVAGVDPAPEDADVDSVAERLDAGEPERRREAIDRLLSLAGDVPSEVARVRSAIRDALDDDDPAVRASACQLLARLGDDGAIDRLEELRLDQDAGVSDAASDALARIEQTEPVTPAEPDEDATSDSKKRTELVGAFAEIYGTSWRMTAGDPAHSGAHLGDVPTVDPTISWTHETNDGTRVIAPVADETRVVVATSEGMLALDAESGSRRWAHEVEGQPVSAPAIGDDMVYVSTMTPDERDDVEGRVHAVDATSGRRQWVLDTERCFTPTVHDDALYVGGGAVHAIAGATGEECWQFGGATESETVALPTSAAHPSLDPDTVHVAGTSARALDRATGDVRWQRSLDGRARSPPIVTEGTVFVGLGDGTVLALDTETGDPRWSRWIEGKPWVSATDGERLYLGNEATDVRALDAETGDDAWIHETDESVPPVAVGDGLVLCGGSDLRALDADSGDCVWTVETEGKAFTPAIADGIVYISTGEGRVHAIDEAVAGER